MVFWCLAYSRTLRRYIFQSGFFKLQDRLALVLVINSDCRLKDGSYFVSIAEQFGCTIHLIKVILTCVNLICQHNLVLFLEIQLKCTGQD